MSRSLLKIGGGLTGLAVLLGLMLLPGCEPDPYPVNIQYPARADKLVIRFTADEVLEPPPLGNQLVALKHDPNAKILDPATINPDVRQELQDWLLTTFGTPAQPTVRLDRNQLEDPDQVDEAWQKTLYLDDEGLARGSVLYRRHCVHCHGLAGDGRGSTAAWVHPHPRDFRRGVFKFTSVSGGTLHGGSKPRREDLLRTLRRGVEGTSMPSFSLLSEQELGDLVSYVVHLTLRGEVEFFTLAGLDTGEVDAKGLKTSLPGILGERLSYWLRAEATDAGGRKGTPIEAESYPYGEPDNMPADSISKGFKLFNGLGGCAACHTDYGRSAHFRADEWGSLGRPANLTSGVYRGGRRPLDLYYRIHSGIGGTGMPGAGKTDGISASDLWDLVNFVRALPYPAMLPDDVRKAVYGGR